MSDIDTEMFDSDDLSEIVVKCLARDSDVMDAAQRYQMTPDDLVVGLKGYGIYRDFAKLIFKLGSPVDKDLFKMQVGMQKKKGVYDAYEEETLDELVANIFDNEAPKSQYVLENLFAMIEHRRRKKIFQQVMIDADEKRCQTELAKLADDMQAAKVSALSRSILPFEKMVVTERKCGVLSGIGILDEKTGGVGKGECALILGHSGSGKTAVASFLMREAAIHGFNALYISAEEPAENIVNRWYAQQFGINYTALHKGDPIALNELAEAFANMSEDTKEKLMKLRIEDVRELTPIDENGLKKVIERVAATGFIPDVVMIDQMDYLKTKQQMSKGAAKWEMYERVSFDMDHLSQYKIQGEHEFALWVVHQATGDMQWSFTYNDIAGFKGIVKPFDLAIGIGREDRESRHVNIFSLKVRHTEHFSSPYRAEFEYMKFYDDKNFKPKAIREKEARAVAKGKKKPKENPIKDEAETEE